MNERLRRKPVENDSFRIWVREQRKKKKISQAVLGVRSGLDPSAISRIERGERDVSLKTAKNLVSALTTTAVLGRDIRRGKSEVRYPDKPFSDWLYEHRVKIGLSQRKLAELSGVDTTAISRIERNIRHARLKTANRLARALGTPYR